MIAIATDRINYYIKPDMCAENAWGDMQIIKGRVIDNCTYTLVFIQYEYGSKYDYSLSLIEF